MTAGTAKPSPKRNLTPKSRSRSKNASSGRELCSTHFLENYQRELHSKSSNIMNLTEDIKKLLEAVKRNRNDISTTNVLN